MFIYLLKSDVTGHYKIGYSQNPEERIKNLQTGNPEKLRILIKVAINPTFARKVETAIHEQFSYVRKEGEWFTLTLEDEYGFENAVKKAERNIQFLHENGNHFM